MSGQPSQGRLCVGQLEVAAAGPLRVPMADERVLALGGGVRVVGEGQQGARRAGW